LTLTDVTASCGTTTLNKLTRLRISTTSSAVIRENSGVSYLTSVQAVVWLDSVGVCLVLTRCAHMSDICIGAVFWHARVHKSYSNIEPAVQSSWPAVTERTDCKCIWFIPHDFCD